MGLFDWIQLTEAAAEKLGLCTCAGAWQTKTLPHLFCRHLELNYSTTTGFTLRDMKRETEADVAEAFFLAFHGDCRSCGRSWTEVELLLGVQPFKVSGDD